MFLLKIGLVWPVDQQINFATPYVVYLFVSVTMISRTLFIPINVWNMSMGVEPWSGAMSTSASKLHSFFVIGFYLSSNFHSSVALFFFLFCFCLAELCPFPDLCCSYWIDLFLFPRYVEWRRYWFELLWVTEVDDWLEVRSVAGAEFGLSRPKVLVPSSF